MFCHRFCPQALAKALKVNKILTSIDLGCNGAGTEGAKARCLGRGFVAPGFGKVAPVKDLLHLLSKIYSQSSDWFHKVEQRLLAELAERQQPQAIFN